MQIIPISKWGHSAALRIPQSVLKQVSKSIGDQFQMRVEGSTIILEPVGPSLDALLAKITPENRHVDLIDRPAGNELL